MVVDLNSLEGGGLPCEAPGVGRPAAAQFGGLVRGIQQLTDCRDKRRGVGGRDQARRVARDLGETPGIATNDGRGAGHCFEYR